MKMTKYKLGELVEVTRGASLSGQFYAEEGKLIRLTLGNFNMNGGGFKENTSKTDLYFTGTVRDEFILNKGDIITPLTEQSLGLLGTTARIPESGKYIQSQDVALVRCKKGLLDPNFCYYLISSSIVRQQLSAAAQQTKIRHTSPEKIKDCTVWVPDFDVQKNIGRILTDIDNKIAINRQINDNLEAMAKQLYDYWFVQFDFPNEEGKPYKSSGGAMVWNDVVKQFIPQSWRVCKVKDMLPVITGKQDANFATKNGKYKFFTCSQEASNCDIAEFEGSAVLIAGNGDFNVKHYTGSFNAYQRTYVLVPPTKFYAVIFMATSMLLEQFKKNSNGSIIKFITKGDVENIVFFDCGEDALYNRLNNLFFMIEQNNNEIEFLTKQRNELLPLLMNGQASINSD